MKKRKAPGGDGNLLIQVFFYCYSSFHHMKKRKTPEGDGNFINTYFIKYFLKFVFMKKRKTPEGDGNSLRLTPTSPSSNFTHEKKKNPRRGR
ncbi:hypothetical protein [Peptoniphilus harei]|uniref:hypothetical protein n=1 Tax=Peptoniphilus harei TaxID=54005 RepID=UPI00190FE0E4|nr:hypothetical protein [Peptoniphilus harei]QQE47561.1 hypothetical protein I6H69_03635 [Peptoniphilus harei]